jgi:hypothetical protein
MAVLEHRFLHGRSAHLARTVDLLCIVLYPFGKPTDQLGWNHQASRRSLDATDGAKRNGRKLGISGAPALRAAQSRHEVLRLIPGDFDIGRHYADPVAGSKPESERLRGKMGAFDKQECLSKLILFGEASLRRALGEFVVHFHAERNHQGKGNVLLFSLDR